MADFLTIDVYRDPVRRTPARRRSLRAALANRPSGLRAHTINHANTGTFTIIPRHYGTCLLLAWESRDAAHAAWHGALGAALGRAGGLPPGWRGCPRTDRARRRSVARLAARRRRSHAD